MQIFIQKSIVAIKEYPHKLLAIATVTQRLLLITTKKTYEMLLTISLLITKVEMLKFIKQTI